MFMFTYLKSSRLKHLSILFGMLILASGIAQAQTEHTGNAGLKKNQVAAIMRMGPEFLYLAAAQAIENGNPPLAIGFLKAVVEKDEQAVLPRLQLSELLLQMRRISEARTYIKELLAMPGLKDKQQAKVQMLNVQLLVQDGKKTKAISTLQTMVNRTPDSYPLRLMLVRLLTREQRLAEAHRVLQDGLKIQPYPQFYQIDAQIYIREGMLKKAEKSLKTLMKIEPGAATPVLMYSQLLLRQKQPVKAENILRHFLVRYPASLSINNALGRLLVSQGRSKEATRVYEEIAKRSGGNPDVLIALGLLYYQQRSFSKAADAFRQSLSQHKNPHAAFFLAASLESLGKKEEPRKLYQTIKPGDENYADAQLRLAALDLRSNNSDSAIRTIHALIQLKPGFAKAYDLLSAALLRKKAYRQLLDETEPALALPDVPTQLLFNRAAAFEGLKQFPQATGQIKQLFNIDPDNIEALNFLGYLYAEQGIHLEEAEKLIRRALQKSPDNGYYIDSLAWVHFKRAEYNKALNLQNKAVKIVPKDPVMREHLGDILWKNGQTAAARAAWKKAVQLGHHAHSRMQQKIKRGI